MAASTRTPEKGGKDRLGLWIGLALGALVLCYIGVLEMSRPHVSGDELRYDQLVELAQSGMLVNAHVLDEDAYVVGSYIAETPEFGAEATPKAYNAPLIRGTQRDLLNLFIESRVPVTVDQQVGKRVVSLASILLPSLMLVTLFVYLILSYRRGTGLFGIRSVATRFEAEDGGVTFADVAGQDAAVAELRELKEFLSDPERFTGMGVAVPKGVLLYGPPGCGKTLLAKALASEAGAAFYSISGSDFVELYAGVGAARVRELFKEARANAPALIFVDELDSVGRARGGGGPGAASSHGEQEQALNQVLAEMDGFSTGERVIVLGATNRPDILDQALLRPGRFDRTIGLERPDETARRAILQVHARRTSLGVDVDLDAVANRAIGLTGADLAAVVNDAALLALRAERTSVAQADLDAAVQRILEAPERQRRLSLRDKGIGRRSGAEERLTFAEVAGVDDAIAELAEVRDYLADPARFAAVGARVPRGILLSGPPGCGKTLLARAVAGEANAAFLSVAGSEFVEVFAGEGASRVRELFAEAAAIAPAIVFIDEIDAIGARRSTGAADGHREREQTLNQILVELDGFAGRAGVIVMAATNRPDILDSALVRPGRFDRHVAIQLPDRAGRSAILALHAAGKPLGPDVDLDKVAGITLGFSGADLDNVLNEAALLAARRGSPEISLPLVEEAVERAHGGVASRGTVLSEHERAVVAHHEAGHALVASLLTGARPHRLSILASGGSLGRCVTIDSHDRVMFSRPMMLDQMATLLGGWAAERLVFDSNASGVASDLQRVTELAGRMVREFGMSEALGPLDYRDTGGRSPEVARLVDAETRRLVEEAGRQATVLLTHARPQLDALAAALLERETLTGADLADLLTLREQATW
ncbi:MAG: AAA family ATPase [Mycobacteriales bacterium]